MSRSSTDGTTRISWSLLRKAGPSSGTDLHLHVLHRVPAGRQVALAGASRPILGHVRPLDLAEVERDLLERHFVAALGGAAGTHARHHDGAHLVLHVLELVATGAADLELDRRNVL